MPNISFPLLKLSLEDRIVVYGILDSRYPEYQTMRWELEKKIFGIKIHWTVTVKGVLADIIGAHP